jgi:hypothetical protein
MARTLEQSFRRYLATVVDTMGLDWLIEHLGAKQIIETIGLKRIVAVLGGVQQLWEALTPEQRRELKQLAEERPHVRRRRGCGAVRRGCFAWPAAFQEAEQRRTAPIAWVASQ